MFNRLLYRKTKHVSEHVSIEGRRIYDNQQGRGSEAQKSACGGEAVFDRIFIEPYKHKTIIGFRGGNVLNDVAENDLEDCGLSGFAKETISNGSPTIPGTMIEETSPEFQKIFQSADLIVAKGQGNFETLNESDRPIAFLFLSKCPVVAGLLKTGIKETQIRTINF